MEKKGTITAVLGLQRGDEGKGRVIDDIAPNFDVVARFNGGANAGHSIVLEDGRVLKLHQIPSGIAYPGKLNIIGNGVLLDPEELLKEIKTVQSQGITVNPDNLLVSEGAALVLPHHKILDHYREEGQGKQGSTKRGIAYAAADKYARSGATTELLREDPQQLATIAFNGLCQALPTSARFGREHLASMAVDWVNSSLGINQYLAFTQGVLRDRLGDGSRVLAEGAQAFGLDIEHGPAPMVTSSHTTVGGIINGLGVPHNRIGDIIGVAKLLKSHVGEGPFVTEIVDNDQLASKIRGPLTDVDSEHGSTTGRPRRVGYPDLVELRRAIYINGVTELAVTKLDRLTRYGKTILVATGYWHEGQLVKDIPGASARTLAKCKPEYEEFPLWDETIDISRIQKFGKLPKKARMLVKFIEEYLSTEIKMVGVGPARQQLIKRG
jgi:adenylosuccinate synthase